MWNRIYKSNMNSKLAGTTMSKISSEKSRFGLDVSNSILCSPSPEDEQSILFETSRPSVFQSHHSFKRDFAHCCTRKFTIHIYIYSLSYSSHHAKLQTPFILTMIIIACKQISFKTHKFPPRELLSNDL